MPMRVGAYFFSFVLAIFSGAAHLDAATMLVYGPTSGCYADATPGYTVTVWSAAVWATKTTADFAAFDVIVFGDCGPYGGCDTIPSTFAAAAANAAVWSPAITGNKIIIGTDTDFHAMYIPSIITTIQDMVNFAAADPAPGPGLYVALGCSYEGSPATTVPFLSGFGSFVVQDSGTTCSDAVVKLASHPALASVTSADLSNWGCSVHEGFLSWPAGFQPLAMATDVSIAPYTATDGSTGLVYILASGSSVVSILTPVGTPTNTPTITLTFSQSPTLTVSGTYTPTPTITATFSHSPTLTASASPSPTPTATPSATGTPTASRTASATVTPTLTASVTATPTPSITLTFSASPTWSASPTISPTFSISPTFTITKTPVDQPGQVDIRGVYPNPFSDWVHAILVLKSDALVDIQVYNVAGEPVYEEKTPRLAGVSIWDWNGSNNAGARLASGVYVVRASSPDFAGQPSYIVVAIAR